ncbi:MAG: AMP-binding protein, partial [Propionibacteriaceae bacterium]|nr:AMP-binding protein [Propionibacteriaceae bacterium]
AWDELLTAAEKVAPERLEEIAAGLDPNDPINIQYTSGTTGFPKGATLSHVNILNNGFFTGELCRYTSADRVCIPVPFYHCFGMVLGNLACTTHGATIVVPGARFLPDKVLQTVNDERCTSLYGVPTMFIAELNHPDFDKYDLSRLRTGIMAGAPCPVDTMRDVIDKMN